MNPKEYTKWKKQIESFMKMQGESKKFIEFVLNWFDGMKGQEELDLIKNFHPNFKNADSKEIYAFIDSARFIPENLNEKDFRNQNFNSAFFLYRPLLKLKFMKEKS